MIHVTVVDLPHGTIRFTRGRGHVMDDAELDTKLQVQAAVDLATSTRFRERQFSTYPAAMPFTRRRP